MASGREIYSAFCRGQAAARPGFLPLVGDLPARVQGSTYQDLNTDPVMWAAALSKTLELGGFDGMVVGCDPTLLAEALGCPCLWLDDRPKITGPVPALNPEPEKSPRLAAFLGTCGRLFPVIRGRAACLAALTGPLELAHMVFGPDEAPGRLAELKRPLAAVVEALCSLETDGVVFLEGAALSGAELTPAIRRIYNTPRNILSHYQMLCGLRVQGAARRDLDRLETLNLDFHIPDQPGDWDPKIYPELCRPVEGAMGLGLGLPMANHSAATRIVKQAAEGCLQNGRCNLFFTSQGPLNRDTDLENLKQLVTEISRVGA